MVELMIAVTLGLLVTGAVISVFVGSRSAYQSTSGIAAATDAGRYAVDVIQETARGGGYMACNHTTTTSSFNDLNLLVSPLAFDFRFGIEGYESVGTGVGGALVLPAAPAADGAVADWTPNLDPTFNAAVNKQVKGNDILVIRSSVPRVSTAYTTAAIAAGDSSFLVANGSTLQGSQLAVLSDCTKSVTFQISGVAGGTPATVNIAGATGAPGNASVTLPYEFSAGALVTPVTTVVYYVGVGADGDSALKRLELVNGMPTGAQLFTDEEVAPDIENMQVLYGIDTNGTQTASAYMTADQVADFTTVVSVKVAVLAASALGARKPPAAAQIYTVLGTSVTAPIDTRVRRVFEVDITARSAVN